jgi:hypothetical protein
MSLTKKDWLLLVVAVFVCVKTVIVLDALARHQIGSVSLHALHITTVLAVMAGIIWTIFRVAVDLTRMRQ